MLFRLATRFLYNVSPRLAWKAGRLWVMPGMKTLAAYEKRMKEDKLFPPFLMLALTDACNLRCRGCWITSIEETQHAAAPRELSVEQVQTAIDAGKKQACYYYTLLGGEPLMYPHLWEILERNRDCYFQVITNGVFLDEAAAKRLRACGNVTVLLSLDGTQACNDRRRGEGVYEAVKEAARQLHRQGILFGVATTVTAENLADVATDAYVDEIMRWGAMYLWYYIFRPTGAEPSPELAVSGEGILTLRKKILELRRRKGIIIIDTYWNAKGEAVCPAARGMSFHIGPGGSIEPCPPISFARENIMDNDGDLFKTINESAYLRGFQDFVNRRTQGCVILEYPQELAEFLREHDVTDCTGRPDGISELAAATPKPSHHQPGDEIPENSWFYRFLKKKLFFGLGGYG